MSSVPSKRYRPCCAAFESHLVSCANDLRFEYWERCDRWFVIVADGSGDGIPIRYCPHCGTRLPRFGHRSGH